MIERILSRRVAQKLENKVTELDGEELSRVSGGFVSRVVQVYCTCGGSENDMCDQVQ